MGLIAAIWPHVVIIVRDWQQSC